MSQKTIPLVAHAKRALSMLLALAMLFTMAAFTSPLTVEAASTATTYDSLRSYINSYYNSMDGDHRCIKKEVTISNQPHTFYASNTTNGISFIIYTEIDDSIFHTSFVLTRGATSVSVEHFALMYYMGSFGPMPDSVSTSINVVMANHTPTSTYALPEGGDHYTASQFSSIFNPHFQLLCTYWDGYLYLQAGIDFSDLGFTSYNNADIEETPDPEHFAKVSTKTVKAVCNNLSKPHNAWGYTKAVLQRYSRDNPIAYTIRLEEMYVGDTANAIVEDENRYNDNPNANQHWILMKFYLKNNGSGKLEADDVIYYDRFYTETGAAVPVADMAVFSGDRSDMGVFDVDLYGGASGYVWLGILVPKTVKFPYLKINNGYDKANRDEKISWLSTDPMSNYTITLSASQYAYDGKVKTPTVTVKDAAGKTLKKDTDYTLTYSAGRKALGKYTVTVTLKGQHQGVKVLPFQIVLATPTVKIANASKGVKVAWNKIAGATGYIVYRSVYSGGKWSAWKVMGKVTSTSYGDTKVKSGATVKYTVRAYRGSSKSAYKASAATKFLAQPATKVSKTSTSLKATWSKSAGATGYILYRRTYSKGKWSAWTRVAKTKSLSYNDKTAKRGVQYQYTARAYSGSYKSSYTASKTAKR